MKRGYIFLLICLAHMSVLAQQPYKAGQKKLIEFGWDIQNYDYVAQNLAAMEYAPFEGIAFDVKVPKLNTRRPWSVCNPQLVRETDFDFTKLQQIRSQKFTDNFVRVFMQDDYEQAGFSWFDDAVWANISASTKVLGKVVVASQAKGIFLDTEHYFDPNPWAYNTTLYPTQSTTTVYNKVRQRGREFMTALQSEAPQAKVLYLFGYGASTNWGSNIYYTQEYALLKPFLDGMLEAAGSQITLIDGNEAGYWSHQNDLYTWWYGQIKVQYLLDRVPANLTTKYQAQYQVASPMILNQHFNIPYGQAGYDFNYNFSPADQKRWAEHAIYNNLLTTDEYAWTWSQGDVDWWTKPTFQNKQDVIDAINSAKQKLANGQAVGSVMVADGNTKLQARFEQGGATVTLSGPTHQGSVAAGSVTFNLGMADPSQLSYCYLYINSAYNKYMASVSTLTVLTNGRYTAWCYGLTKDGKAFQTNHITFTVGAGDMQAPTVPIGLQATGVTTTTANITWSNSTDNVGVTGYDVFRDLLFVGTTTITSYQLTGLTPNTGYAISVKARDAAGNVSAQSGYLPVQTLALIDTQAPSVPQNLQSANITSGSFTVSWNASADNVAVTGYDVFRNGVFVGFSTATNFTFTGLAANTNYAIAVRARDAAGNISTLSPGLLVKTLLLPDVIAPSVPANLQSSGVTTNAFAMTWSASTDNIAVTGYEIFRDGVAVGTSPTTSYQFTGLTANTNYTITVRARDAAGNTSAQSAALVVKTQANPDIIAPSVPTNLQSSGVTTNAFTVTWSASTDNVGVTGYEVYRNGVLVTTVTNTTYSFTGLTPSTSYAITVKARDAAGNISAASAALNVTTLAVTTGAPDCNAITMVAGPGNITINGLTAPNVMIQVFDSQWKTSFACYANCGSGSQIVSGLSAGQYYVKVDFLDAKWVGICQKNQNVQVTSTGATGILTFPTPNNITVQLTPRSSTALVSYNTPQASSTCPTGPVVVARKSGVASGQALAVGIYQVCHTATDACGNTKEVCFTIQVQPAPGGNICDAITVTPRPSGLTVTQLNAPNVIMQLFDNQWKLVGSCFGDCNTTSHVFTGLVPGNYHLKVDLYGAGWTYICQRNIQATVSSNTNLQAQSVLFAQPKGLDVLVDVALASASTLRDVRLERSTDGGAFEVIANLSDAHSKYLDPAPGARIHQYRLSAKQADGKVLELLSNEVTLRAISRALVYPNPASSVVNIDFAETTSEPLTLQIISADGVIVKTQDVENEAIGSMIEIQNLPIGVYQIRIVHPNQRAELHKFVKID
jgi:chitodextrinase